MVLPNLIIAGAPKSGTSSLFRWLSDHPEVLGSSVKETRYFADPDSHVFDPRRHFTTRGIEGYERFFEADGSDFPVVVEATPTYLYSELARRELPNLSSKPDFVFLLREPVAQVQSLFRYFQNNWNWIPPNMRFSDFVAACQSGAAQFGGNELAENALRNAAYVDFLHEWRQACGAARIHVYLFEQAFADERGFMVQLAKRFGIDPKFYATYSFPRENETYEVRSRILQKLNLAVRSRLPQGELYRTARSIYRAINTSVQPRRQSLRPRPEVLAAGLFHQANERLAREFDLDLEPWRNLERARAASASQGARSTACTTSTA